MTCRRVAEWSPTRRAVPWLRPAKTSSASRATAAVRDLRRGQPSLREARTRSRVHAQEVRGRHQIRRALAGAPSSLRKQLSIIIPNPHLLKGRGARGLGRHVADDGHGGVGGRTASSRGPCRAPRRSSILGRASPWWRNRKKRRVALADAAAQRARGAGRQRSGPSASSSSTP